MPDKPYYRTCSAHRCKQEALHNVENRWWSTCLEHALGIAQRDFDKAEAALAALKRVAAERQLFPPDTALDGPDDPVQAADVVPTDDTEEQ